MDVIDELEGVHSDILAGTANTISAKTIMTVCKTLDDQNKTTLSMMKMFLIVLYAARDENSHLNMLISIDMAIESCHRYIERYENNSKIVS